MIRPLKFLFEADIFWEVTQNAMNVNIDRG